MASEKDYAVQFVAREQAELRVVERDSTPLAPDEIAGRSLVTLISAGTESTGSYTSEGGHPRGSGYAGVFEVESVGEGVDDIKAGITSSVWGIIDPISVSSGTPPCCCPKDSHRRPAFSLG